MGDHRLLNQLVGGHNIVALPCSCFVGDLMRDPNFRPQGRSFLSIISCHVCIIEVHAADFDNKCFVIIYFFPVTDLTAVK